MKEQKIAYTYARSIYELGQAQGVDLGAELTQFTELVNSSNDLENALFLDLFTSEEKKGVLSEICSRMKWSDLFKGVVDYLVETKRIGLLPLIFKEITILEDHQKGFLRGIIEGREATPDPAIQARLITHLEKKTGKKIAPSYQVNPAVSAGYKVTVGDLQLDATVENQLEQFKHSILGER